jgi:hypothetical protein
MSDNSPSGTLIRASGGDKIKGELWRGEFGCMTRIVSDTQRKAEPPRAQRTLFAGLSRN